MFAFISCKREIFIDVKKNKETWLNYIIPAFSRRPINDITPYNCLQQMAFTYLSKALCRSDTLSRVFYAFGKLTGNVHPITGHQGPRGGVEV
jgi:hypothetical protein